MRWNCQQNDWPIFSYDPAALESLEKRFLLHSGEFLGAYRHVSPEGLANLAECRALSLRSASLVRLVSHRCAI